MEPNKSKIKRFHQRDLSWLSFNERVLQEAADPSVPLYERLKFLAIYSNNLDEFFRVRVSALRSFRALKKTDRQVEKRPKRTLKAITRIIDAQQRRFGEIFRLSIVPELAQEGITLVKSSAFTPADRDASKAIFEKAIIPSNIQTFVLGPGDAGRHFLNNRDLYLVVDLGSETEIGLIDLPTESVDRFLWLSHEQGQQRIAFLDDVVRDNIVHFFPNAVTAYAITMSRDAELYIEDEYEGDLIKKLTDAVAQRDSGLPTRFLYDSSMPQALLSRLSDLFQLSRLDLVSGGRYHHFHDFFGFPLPADKQHLIYPPMSPLDHPILGSVDSLLDTIWKKDQILHFPYQKFEYLPNMLEEAIAHDECVHISMTLYRTSKDSIVARSLLRALEKNIEVTVFIEAKARFDEQNNIFWGKKLEEAGAKVIFSYPGIKVHSKLLLIQFSDKRKNIAYIGTGNFNEKTARIYTDHALITSNKKITREVVRIFKILDRNLIIPRNTTLLISPFDSRSRLTEKVEREIALARKGRPAELAFKMNSLEDKPMVRKLQQAAQEGVRIRLLVRGIFVLNTDFVPDTDLEAISIVDRYLEHGRLYYFGNDGNPELLIGSADLMGRNLDRRIEVLTPILDKDVFAELMEIFELQWNDNVKARKLEGLLANQYREKGDQRSQYDIYRYLEAKIPK
ncbi:MAG: polyphosphate kinase 1 [Saprospiraceae bacterium]|nr:polyphosphate kinase 1 [Saprospiraceae bacterium]